MNRIQPKPVRRRLEADAYEELRQRVLRRDGWRCQWCGSRCHLEVHHKEFRSHSGGVSRLLCKRPRLFLGDGVPGKGAIPLPRPISVEVGCAFIA